MVNEHIDVLAKRKLISDSYKLQLANIKGISCLEDDGASKKNYSYFPIIVQDDYPLSRDNLYEFLKLNGIHAWRYFYPLISDFPMFRDFPSARVERRVATQANDFILPIYPDLGDKIRRRQYHSRSMRSNNRNF